VKQQSYSVESTGPGRPLWGLAKATFLEGVIFTEMILQLPNFIRFTAVAISECTNTTDGTHFDSESATIMGNRYATEMKKLQLELTNKE